MAPHGDLRARVSRTAEFTHEPAATEPRTTIPISIVPMHTAVPGRARLRVAGLRGAPFLGKFLEGGLGALEGVWSVSASPLTGNVLVQYDSGASLDQIIGRIDALLRGEIGSQDDGRSPDWHSANPAELARDLGSSITRGLSGAAAAERLASVGQNMLPPLQQRSELSILLGQFQSLPVALLATAAVISFATGGLLEATAILAVVALNAAIGFSTESRAEQTIRSLGIPGPLMAKVVRDGVANEVPAETLVPGDLIVLQQGMVVPADARVVSTRALTVSEAALTGESLPVVKSVEPFGELGEGLAGRTNMVYRGTIVTGGSGNALAVVTGARTEVGRIQRLVGETLSPETPIQQQLRQVGGQLVWATLGASAAIFGIGWLRGLALLQLARSSLSVAVAAVPEGLPMVATTTLVFGIENMRRRGILVRRLDALETLAAVNVICFDKTGTLTHDSMSVEAIAVGGRICRPKHGVFLDRDGVAVRQQEDARLQNLLSVAGLCSETDIEERDGRNVLSGSATENALIQAALDSGIDVLRLRRDFARRSIQYRTEAYRFMATTHAAGSGILIAVKGSPREVLHRCARECLRDGGQCRLTATRRAEIESLNAELAGQALRVLGVAYAEIPDGGANALGTDIAIEDLTWVGLVGLADPVRPGVRELMESLHRAGIQTIMLTGDQSATARAIGEKIGLSPSGKMEILEPADLERLTTAELGVAARRAHAFARISPGQKLRIVRALQESDAVVAMMGDGINDSPALRAANVGIAVGRNGAATAREIADVFLATDDLKTLLVAIQRGRGTYSNIRKAIHYILSTNTSEIMVMLAGTAAGLEQALSPMQLLWINLISDVLPAIGLAMEAPDPNLMEKAPPHDQAIVSPDQFSRLGMEAGILAAGASAAGLYTATRHGFGSAQSRTVTFGSLVSSQLLHAISCRSAQGTFELEPRSTNSALLGIVAGSLALQSAALLVPGIRNLLGITPIGALDAVAMIAGGVLPFFVNEARKPEGGRTAIPSLHFRRDTRSEQAEATSGWQTRPEPSDAF
jgi:P-type Ca2+ transporter type 2C